MAQVYIVARRAEVQNGSVMITDLFPNASQRNTSIDPPASGPIYVRQVDLGVQGLHRVVLKTTAGVVSFVNEAKGLVPFLLKNVASGANGDALTIGEATVGAKAILNLVRTGVAVDLASVNAILELATVGGAGTDLSANSTIEELVRVLAGETYLVPAGSQITLANGNFAVDLNASSYFQSDVLHPVDGDSSWLVSLEEGCLKGLTSLQDPDVVFAGKKVATPIVTVYNANGTLFTL